jgi:hypothetical protein
MVGRYWTREPRSEQAVNPETANLNEAVDPIGRSVLRGFQTLDA